MAEHGITRHKTRKTAMATKVGKSTVAKKTVKKPGAKADVEHGAKIVVLTDDPHRNVVIVPGCHLDSMRGQDNVYFFEDGNELVGMIVEGGTVQYRAADHTYVVRLTGGQRTAD